jgi:hypothetical protein
MHTILMVFFLYSMLGNYEGENLLGSIQGSHGGFDSRRNQLNPSSGFEKGTPLLPLLRGN